LLSESLMIDIVALGVEYPGWIAILGHAIVAEIGEMGVQRRSLRAMTHDSGFDHRSARPVGQISCRREAGGAAPAKGSLGSRCRRSARHPTGSFGGGERLGNEWLGPLASCGSGAPWADAKIVISFHGASNRKLSSSQISQRIIAFTKVMAACAPLPRALLFLDFLPIRPPSKVRLLSCLSNRAIFVNAFLALTSASPSCSPLSISYRSYVTASYARWWSMHFYGLGLKPAPCWPKRSRSAPSTHAVSSKLARQDSGFHSGPRHHHGRLSAVADAVKLSSM
jgi:hypothetical protein